MTYGVTILTVRECCRETQLSWSVRVLKPGLIHRFGICAAKQNWNGEQAELLDLIIFGCLIVNMLTALDVVQRIG